MVSHFQTTYANPDESHRDTRSQIEALQAHLAQITQQQSQSQLLSAAQEGPADQFLVFTLLEHDFAIKAEYIQGVERTMEVTLVPNLASWVSGVINMRGSILSVVDLRRLLELAPAPATARTRLLSLHFNGMAICFLVDSVSEMLPIPSVAIRNGQISARQSLIPSWATPYASQCALLNHRNIILLDVARLVFSEKIQRYQTLE